MSTILQKVTVLLTPLHNLLFTIKQRGNMCIVERMVWPLGRHARRSTASIARSRHAPMLFASTSLFPTGENAQHAVVRETASETPTRSHGSTMRTFQRTPARRSCVIPRITSQSSSKMTKRRPEWQRKASRLSSFKRMLFAVESPAVERIADPQKTQMNPMTVRAWNAAQHDSSSTVARNDTRLTDSITLFFTFVHSPASRGAYLCAGSGSFLVLLI